MCHRRFTVVGAVGLMLLVPVARGQVFTQQSARPTGRNLGGSAALSPTHAMVVGDNHHLLETTDGGVTWVKRMGTAYSTDPFYTIEFPDALHGYIAGNSQDAYRTVDGGAHWIKMNSMLAGSVRDLDFMTPTTGFAGYNGAMAWTPDGGVTWQLRSGYPDCPVVYGMDFRDAVVGIVAGHMISTDQVGLHRTVDGGVTWSCVREGYTNDVLWLDQQSVVACDGLDCIRSDDEGVSWYTLSSGWIDTGLSAMARAGDSETIGGVSSSGDIWISHDLGSSWQQVVEGIGVLPADWNISFFDDGNGWVSGANGLVYRTTDGGDHWTLVNNGCGDEVTDIDFFDNDNGIAVTNRGFVFATHDGGKTWPVQRLKETGLLFGRDEGLGAACMLDRDNIVVAGEGGVVFRSSDGGGTWTSVGWPWGNVSEYFEALTICFADPSNGWMAGNQGPTTVYRTRDGGWTWEEVPGMGAYFIASDFKGARGLLCTGGSAVYRTTSGGDSWSMIPLPGDLAYLSDLSFADADHGWAVGWYGYIARSTDGGSTWTQQVQPTNETFMGVTAISASEAWTVGYDQDSFKYFYKRTTNGGKTWTRTTITGEEFYSRIHVRPSGRVWIGGMFGAIIHRPAPPITITLPIDTPRAVKEGQTNTIPVRVVAGEEGIVEGSQTLWFRRRATEPYQPLPLVRVSGDDYSAVLPSLGCADAPQFYFSAQGLGGSTVRLPANAPGSVYSSLVGVYQTKDLLSVDFEGGLPAGWTATGLWHVTASCAPGGTACGGGKRAYFGQDTTCTFDTGATAAGSLTSPPVALPQIDPGQSLTMSFCHALRTQNGENSLSDYDKAIVWIIQGATRSPLEWCVDRNVSRSLSYDLSAYAGKTVRFEWNFDSVDAIQNNARGWHVDNVLVRGPVLVCTDPCRSDFDHSGFTDTDDFDAFVRAFEVGEVSADVDQSGFVDTEDFDAFVRAYEAGC